MFLDHEVGGERLPRGDQRSVPGEALLEDWGIYKTFVMNLDHILG